MSLLFLADMTWPEVRDLDRERAIALLPTGAVEAHGPHLPVSTDGIIARGMVEAAGRGLAAQGLLPLILPGLDYTAAPFAAEFPGTISLRPETLTALVVDIGFAMDAQGFRCLAIANAHLDPAHLGSLSRAIEVLRSETRLAIAYPNIIRRALAGRLTEEFQSGACHAGRYEGSMVMAARPDLVREETQRRLSPNPNSLSTAIGQGKTTFEQAGGPEAYFGDPAAASAQEGQETLKILGTLLVEAVNEALAIDSS